MYSKVEQVKAAKNDGLKDTKITRKKSQKSSGQHKSGGTTGIRCNVIKTVYKEVHNYCKDHLVSLDQLEKGLKPDVEGLELDGRNVDVVLDTDEEEEDSEEMDLSSGKDNMEKDSKTGSAYNMIDDEAEEDDDGEEEEDSC